MLIVLCSYVFSDATRNILVAMTNLPDGETLHVLSRALDLTPGPSRPITIVAISERDYSRFGRPLPMAKSLLVDLIEKVRGKNPNAIIVDFDISTRTSTDDTVRLQNLLASWTKVDPPLIFPRELLATENELQFSTEPTSFDGLFDPGRNLFWTNSIFQTGDSQKISAWNLWETPANTCNAILSPQLLLQQLEKTTSIKRLEACLGAQDRGNLCKAQIGCRPEYADFGEGLLNRKTAPVHFVLSDDGLHGPSSEMIRRDDGSRTPALYTWSAGDVLDRPMADLAFTGRTVIIGGAYAQANDRHDTPVGPMEGMRVIANAIATSQPVLSAPIASASLTAAVSTALSIVGLIAFLRLKPIVFGSLYFALALAVYSVLVHAGGPDMAVSVLSHTIGLTAVLVGTESLLSLLLDLIVRRRGWHAIMND